MNAAAPFSSGQSPGSTLLGMRVIGLLNGTEIFGQERANVEVFKSLRRQGAEVIVGLKEGGGHKLPDYIRSSGFDVFFIPFGCQWSKKFFYERPSLLPRNIWKVCLCSRELAAQIHRFKPTHIHFGNPLVYSFIAPYLACNRKIKLIYRMGDIPPYDSKPNYLIWRAGVRRTYRIVANSIYVRDQILRSYPSGNKIMHLIYNAAPGDNPTLISSHPNDDLNAPLRVVYVGQIAEHKGVRHFVDCAIELAKRDARWHFDIVGGSMYSGALESQLKRQIASEGMHSQVVMHGSVSDPAEFYRGALVTVVPSLWEEPAANVVLEAKRFGVPTIVYPSGGLPELVSDGKTGWICSEKTKNCLKGHLERCLTRPESCVAMRQPCLTDYSERFGQERFDRQWAEVYRE